MAQEPQNPYLNHTYFGPTIPISDQNTDAHHQIKSRFKKCSPYSLLCHLFKVITSVIIIIGIIVLILWLVYQPTKLKVFVETADLAQFNLSSSNKISFNLTAQLSIRNPNKRVGIRYKDINPILFYGGVVLERDDQQSFFQPKKSTVLLNTSFAGETMNVGDEVKAKYGGEKEEGWVYVDLNVYTKVRLKMVIVNSVKYTPEIDCSLRLPVPTNASSTAVGFTRTECHVGDFS